VRFFGRAREVADLCRRVGRERLVSLVGAPGSGKTRLAVEVGVQVAPAFGGGVRFVDLAPVGDPELVVAAVGRALGVPEQRGQPMREVLVEALRGAQPVLVLLDNCEHVAEAAAAVSADLLADCPPVSLLTTSRTALRVRDEQLWDVPPLDLVSAVGLFTDRAWSLRGGPSLDPSDATVIEAICSLLDCLPLAVELTAAWTRVLSPGQILDRLENGARELPAPGRGAERRHATMAAAVERSYELLSVPARQVYRRMSVFAGGFDLEALEAIAGPDHADGDVLGGLTELVDNSLVLAARVGGGPVRYRLLEPVRQHARAVLDRSGDGDRIRRRHFDHYLDLASRYDPWRWGAIDRPVRVERLAAEETNLLAAFEWARRQPSDLGLRLITAASLHLTYSGRVNDTLRWLEEALAKGTEDRALRTKAVREAGQLAWLRGAYDLAHTRLEEALELAQTLGDPLQVAWGHRLLSIAELSAGDVAGSAIHAQQALDACEACQDQVGVAASLTSRAWPRYAVGDANGGDDDMRAALAVNRRVGNPTVTAFGHLGLNYGAALRGDTDEQRFHLAAARVAIDDGGVVERLDWLGMSAVLAAHEGRYHAALRLLGGAEACEQQRGGTKTPATLTVPFQPLFEQVVKEVTGTLFGQLWDQGRRMSWDELVAEALALQPDRSRLTTRENEIAELVAEGLTNGDIAQRLALSRRTVESHIDHIKQKLALANRNQIIVWALRQQQSRTT
jgi:predicted ATPase/DNA-binding CsgD family transcriptional regulator